MKLSTMNTKELSNAMCVMAEPLSRIATDQKMMDFLKELTETSGKTVLDIVRVATGSLIPLLLKDHEEDTYLVMSALTCKTVNEIQNQNGLQTIQEIKDSIDEDLIRFFTSLPALKREA